jgi:hypothetical protein
MFTSSKTTLSAAVILGFLGCALPALASDHNGQDKTYGGPVQTWCDINPDCNGWNKGQHRASYESSAPGLAVSPPRKPHPSRKHSHEASNR